MHVESNKGLTIFEVLVYIGLFSLIMFGALVGALSIINSSTETRQKVAVEQEAHFIFRKIDWALANDATGVGLLSNGFRVEKPGDDIEFILDGDAITMNTGSGPNDLTSSAVAVSNLTVNIVPANPPVPEALEVSFAIDDRQFATSTRYIR